MVEGFPGSGKSTTAQWVASQIERSGCAPRWIYEQQRPHPVPGPAHDDHGSWDEYFDERVERWAEFAAGVRDGRVVTVLESAFLQSAVMSTLTRDVEPATIVAFLLRIADTLRPLVPTLVYFGETNVDAAYHRVCAARGDRVREAQVARNEATPWAIARGATGFEGLLLYWRVHASICDTVVARCALRTLRIDAATDWTERRRLAAQPAGPPRRRHLRRGVLADHRHLRARCERRGVEPVDRRTRVRVGRRDGTLRANRLTPHRRRARCYAARPLSACPCPRVPLRGPPLAACRRCSAPLSFLSVGVV